MNALGILPSNCDCEKCSSMCKGPCCGTPDDFNRLMDAGYANRLMLDDWPDGAVMLKPALKGYEGETAPWETRTEEGCTFWHNGKCQLHDLDLKPLQGKLSHHSQTWDEMSALCEMMNDAWTAEESTQVIERWKDLVGMGDD